MYSRNKIYVLHAPVEYEYCKSLEELEEKVSLKFNRYKIGDIDQLFDEYKTFLDCELIKMHEKGIIEDIDSYKDVFLNALNISVFKLGYRPRHKCRICGREWKCMDSINYTNETIENTCVFCL